jgi:hypothetical protein
VNFSSLTNNKHLFWYLHFHKFEKLGRLLLSYIFLDFCSEDGGSMFVIFDYGLLGGCAMITWNLGHVSLCKVIPGIFNRTMNSCSYLLPVHILKEFKKNKLITFNVRHSVLCYNYMLLLKMTAFWDIVSCSLTEVGRHFTGVCCLHQKALNSLPCWWRQYVPLKCWPTSTRLHGAIFQKAVFFMLAAMKPEMSRSVVGLACSDLNSE